MAKKTAAYLFDFFILSAAGVCLWLAGRYIIEIHPYILVSIWIFAAVICITYEFCCLFPKHAAKRAAQASALALLDDTQRMVRTWNLMGHTALLIGKNFDGDQPGIDLADTEFDMLIDFQHAVLNYTPKGWVIEDLSSRNGVGIERPSSPRLELLASGLPYPIHPGDIIIIAGETRLAVK